jgi:hypothetical protein
VYDRIWPNQAAFSADVLAELIARSDPLAEHTRRRVRYQLARANTTSLDGRWEGVSRLCRLAVQEHVLAAASDPVRRIVTATVSRLAAGGSRDDGAPTSPSPASSPLASSPPASPLKPGPRFDAPAAFRPSGVEVVRAALRDYWSRELDGLVELYAEIGSRLGFRMRDPLEMRHLVLATGALAEGIATRLGVFDEYRTWRRSTTVTSCSWLGRAAEVVRIQIFAMAALDGPGPPSRMAG